MQCPDKSAQLYNCAIDVLDPVLTLTVYLLFQLNLLCPSHVNGRSNLEKNSIKKIIKKRKILIILCTVNYFSDGKPSLSEFLLRDKVVLWLVW